MNAFSNVNMSASCIETSQGYARALGVPESRLVYPLVAAGTSDGADCR